MSPQQTSDHAVDMDPGHDDQHFTDDIDDYLFGGRESEFPLVYPIVSLLLFLLCTAVAVVLVSRFGWSPTPSELATFGGISQADLDNGAWWKLIASTVLHTGALHYLLNMLFLLAVGAPFERVTGHAFTATVILLGAGAASLGSAIVNPSTVGSGASGVAYALLGATVVLDPVGRTGLGRVARWMLLANIAIGFFLTGLSYGAHIGGFAAGCLVAVAARFAADGTRSGIFRISAAGLLAAGIVSFATHPAIADDLGIDSGIDRPISESQLEERLMTVAADGRPFAVDVTSATCRSVRDDGSAWQCTTELTATLGDTTQQRTENWLATVTRDAEVRAAPVPAGATQAEWAIADWSLEDDEHMLERVQCTEQGTADRSYGCIVTGRRNDTDLNEWWRVHFANDGSWERDAIYPTADGLAAAILSRGLKASGGSTVKIDRAECEMTDPTRTRWRCELHEAGEDAAAATEYTVTAEGDGSWRLDG